MKIAKAPALAAVLTAALFGAGYVAAAQATQSMPDMPGMPAPPASKKPQPQKKPSPPRGMQDSGAQAKPGAQPSQGDSMPGMQMPGDMQHPQPGDIPAQKETQSEHNSEQQQMPGMVMKPRPSSDAQSQTHAAGQLQEPENPGFHTGTDTPAPLLLTEISKRPPMGLDAFLAMADKGNPTIAQANDLVKRSSEQARQAGLYPNPQGGYQGEQIRGGSYGGGEQGGYIRQTIVLGGKLGLRRNIYTQQASSDRIGAEEQHYRVHNDVTQAFYTALTSQALAVVRQHLLQVSEDALTTAHQLANVGQADAPDVLQAEVETEQARIDFNTAQRQFLRNFRVLAAYASEPDLPVTPLAGQPEPPAFDAEQQVTVITANSPTVKRARQEVAVAKARLKDAKREAVPDLLLRAGEQGNGENVALNPRKSVGAQSFAEAGINIPLWNHNQGNIKAAAAEVERAQAEVTRTQLYLRQQAEPLAQDYLAAQFQAQRYRDELIPRAKRAYELYLIKYQQAAEAYPLVIVSQRTLFQTQIGYLQSLEQVWMTSTALENYTLHGGLDAPYSTGSPSTTINLPNGGSSE